MAQQVLKFLVNADNRQAIQSFNSLKRAAGNVSSSVAGWFGAGIGVAAVVMFAKKTMDAADQVDQLSKRFGVSTDFVQKFKYMAEQSGTSLESLSGAMRTMSKNLGGYWGSKAIRELGISTQELRQLKPEEAFERIAKALKNVTNEHDRTRLAQSIFGRGGAQLREMIDNYDALAASAANQMFFTPEQIKAADDFSDSMAQINQSLMAISANTGFLQKLADWADRIATVIELVNRIRGKDETGTSLVTTAVESAAAFNNPVNRAMNPGLANVGRAVGNITNSNREAMTMGDASAKPGTADRIESLLSSLVKNIGGYM